MIFAYWVITSLVSGWICLYKHIVKQMVENLQRTCPKKCVNGKDNPRLTGVVMYPLSRHIIPSILHQTRDLQGVTWVNDYSRERHSAALRMPERLEGMEEAPVLCFQALYELTLIGNKWDIPFPRLKPCQKQTEAH